MLPWVLPLGYGGVGAYGKGTARCQHALNMTFSSLLPLRVVFKRRTKFTFFLLPNLWMYAVLLVSGFDDFLLLNPLILDFRDVLCVLMTMRFMNEIEGYRSRGVVAIV